MKNIIALAALAALATGCSSVKSTTDYTKFEPERPAGYSSVKFYPSQGQPYYGNGYVKQQQ